MRCPACNTEVAELALTCHACGAWLDEAEPADGAPRNVSSRVVPGRPGNVLASGVFSSALSTQQRDVRPRDDEGAAPGPRPRRPSSSARRSETGVPGGDPRPASRRRRTSSASRPPVREQAHGSEAEVPTQEVELQQEGDRKTRIVDIAVPAAVKRAARDKQPVQRRKAANQSADSEQHSVLDDVGHRIKRGYLRIPPMDRLSMWSLGLCFVGAFLPWRYLDGGVMLSGIEGYGLASAFASALALFLLYLRSTVRRLRGLLINVQLLANAASVAAPLYALVSIPNYNWAIGLPLTGVAGMAAMAFTLIRIARVGGS